VGWLSATYRSDQREKRLHISTSFGFKSSKILQSYDPNTFLRRRLAELPSPRSTASLRRTIGQKGNPATQAKQIVAAMRRLIGRGLDPRNSADAKRAVKIVFADVIDQQLNNPCRCREGQEVRAEEAALCSLYIWAYRPIRGKWIDASPPAIKVNIAINTRISTISHTACSIRSGIAIAITDLNTQNTK
jgi:hypothetical protein